MKKLFVILLVGGLLYTYNEYKFISFQVHEMKQEPTVSNRDKFMELFGAAK